MLGQLACYVVLEAIVVLLDKAFQIQTGGLNCVVVSKLFFHEISHQLIQVWGDFGIQEVIRSCSRPFQGLRNSIVMALGLRS